MTEFEAQYQYSKFTLALRLGQPKEILDADGIVVLAYPLESEVKDAPRADHRVYWLSGDLRIVRVDDVCLSDACPPRQAEINWMPRGYWPPWGYAVRGLAEGPQPMQESWGVVQRIIPTITETKDGVSVRIAIDAPTYRATPYLSHTGTYLYSDGDEVPDLIDTGFQWRITEMRRGPALEPIPPLRRIEAQGTPAQGEWFAGSNARLLGANVSFDDAVAWMRGTDPEFADQVSRLCMASAVYTGPQLLSEMLNLRQTRTVGTFFEVTLREPESSTATIWRWQYEETPDSLGLDPPRWVAKGKETLTLTPSPCTPGPAKENVVHDAAEHIALASTLPWEQGKTARTILPEINAGQGLFRLPGERPVTNLLFLTAFAAPGESGLLSSVLEAPVLGAYFGIRGTVAELEALPGAYGQNLGGPAV